MTYSTEESTNSRVVWGPRRTTVVLLLQQVVDDEEKEHPNSYRRTTVQLRQFSDFDESAYDIDLLYRDLDYDANGFLTLDDWMFLRKWVTSNDMRMLDDFRRVLQKNHFKPADAFAKVFDANSNGTLDPLEFVEGFRKLRIKHLNPRRIFELLDVDDSGEPRGGVLG